MGSLEPSNKPTQEQINFINQRWSQLARLDEEAELRALRYLTFTNSGGAITVASFLAGSQYDELPTGPLVALFLYVLGVVLAGALVAYSVHYLKRLFRNWREDTSRYFGGHMDWNLLIDKDRGRTENTRAHIIIGYACFLCFISGSVVAAISLLSQ